MSLRASRRETYVICVEGKKEEREKESVHK